MLGFTVSQATVSRYMPPPTGGMDNRGGLSFAIKPWRSVTASIPRSAREQPLACISSPTGLSSSDQELRRLRPYVWDSGAALPNSRP